MDTRAVNTNSSTFTEEIMEYTKQNKFGSVEDTFISCLLNKLAESNLIENSLFDANLIKSIMDYTRLRDIISQKFPFIEEKIGDYQFYTSIQYSDWNLRSVTNYSRHARTNRYRNVPDIMEFTGFPDLHLLSIKKQFFIPRPLMRSTRFFEQELRRDTNGRLIWINVNSDYYFETQDVSIDDILQYLI
jgi:hypothetical protein